MCFHVLERLGVFLTRVTNLPLEQLTYLLNEVFLCVGNYCLGGISRRTINSPFVRDIWVQKALGKPDKYWVHPLVFLNQQSRSYARQLTYV